MHLGIKWCALMSTSYKTDIGVILHLKLLSIRCLITINTVLFQKPILIIKFINLMNRKIIHSVSEHLVWQLSSIRTVITFVMESGKRLQTKVYELIFVEFCDLLYLKISNQLNLLFSDIDSLINSFLVDDLNEHLKDDIEYPQNNKGGRWECWNNYDIIMI